MRYCQICFASVYKMGGPLISRVAPSFRATHQPDRVGHEGHALEADLVGQWQDRNAFLASLAVFRTHDAMTGALLDAVA